MRDKFMNDLERVYQEVFEESSSKDKLDYKNKKSNRTLSNFKNTLKEIKRKYKSLPRPVQITINTLILFILSRIAYRLLLKLTNMESKKSKEKRYEQAKNEMNRNDNYRTIRFKNGEERVFNIKEEKEKCGYFLEKINRIKKKKKESDNLSIFNQLVDLYNEVEKEMKILGFVPELEKYENKLTKIIGID